MCGRFAFTSPTEAVADFFKADHGRLDKITPNTNVCPTQNIITLVNYENQRVLTQMRWGFIPHWYTKPNDGPLLINARAETIHQKPAYRDAFQHRRCVVPVNYYYEWSSKNPDNIKRKYRIGGAESEFLACAGIWQAWRDENGHRVVSCAIVTQEANAKIAPVHDRMPVLLTLPNVSVWLAPQSRESIFLRLEKKEPELIVETDQ